MNILTAEELVQYRGRIDKVLPVLGEKEFKPSHSWLESKQIHTALEERKDLLEEERVEKLGALSQAEWVPEIRCATATRRVGSYWQFLGHETGGKLLLQPEEALFMLEMNCLELMYDGVALSVQQAYHTLLDSDVGCTLNEYRTYAHLSRCGFRVRRHSEPIKTTSYEQQIRLYQHPQKQKNIKRNHDIYKNSTLDSETPNKETATVEIIDVAMQTPSDLNNEVNIDNQSPQKVVSEDENSTNKTESLKDFNEQNKNNNFTTNRIVEAYDKDIPNVDSQLDLPPNPEIIETYCKERSQNHSSVVQVSQVKRDLFDSLKKRTNILKHKPRKYANIVNSKSHTSGKNITQKEKRKGSLQNPCQTLRIRRNCQKNFAKRARLKSMHEKNKLVQINTICKPETDLVTKPSILIQLECDNQINKKSYIGMHDAITQSIKPFSKRNTFNANSQKTEAQKENEMQEIIISDDETWKDENSIMLCKDENEFKEIEVIDLEDEDKEEEQEEDDSDDDNKSLIHETLPDKRTILNSIFSVQGKAIVHIKIPPKSLLPPNVNPQQELYTIKLERIQRTNMSANNRARTKDGSQCFYHPFNANMSNTVCNASRNHNARPRNYSCHQGYREAFRYGANNPYHRDILNSPWQNRYGTGLLPTPQIYHGFRFQQIQTDFNPGFQQLQADFNPGFQQLQADFNPGFQQLQAIFNPGFQQFPSDVHSQSRYSRNVCSSYVPFFHDFGNTYVKRNPDKIHSNYNQYAHQMVQRKNYKRQFHSYPKTRQSSVTNQYRQLSIGGNMAVSDENNANNGECSTSSHVLNAKDEGHAENVSRELCSNIMLTDENTRQDAQLQSFSPPTKLEKVIQPDLQSSKGSSPEPQHDAVITASPEHISVSVDLIEEDSLINVDIISDAVEPVTPLLQQEQCTSKGNILSSLHIIKTVNLKSLHLEKELGDTPKITFDLYIARENFRKTDPNLPHYRIVVTGCEETIPSVKDMTFLQNAFEDDVPVLFAVVLPDTVQFIHLATVDLNGDTEILF